MSCRFGNLFQKSFKYCRFEIESSQKPRIFPFRLQVSHKPQFIVASYKHELFKEAQSLWVITIPEYLLSVVVVFEFFDLRNEWPQQPRMRQPFTLIVYIFGNQAAQVPIAAVDPFSRVHSRFY